MVESGLKCFALVSLVTNVLLVAGLGPAVDDHKLCSAGSLHCGADYQLYDPSRFFPQGEDSGPEIPVECSAKSGSEEYFLPGNSETGHWGYFYDGLLPSLTIKSGDTVKVEAPTLIAPLAYDLIIEGDPGHESIWGWDETGPLVKTRGAWGGGEGAHWMTGPIYVCDAEPGDVIQVDVVGLVAHPNPGKQGRTWGATWSGSIGFHERVGMKSRGYSEVVTVYEVISKNGEPSYAEPVYQVNIDNITTVTACAPLEGEFPRTTKSGKASWKNPKSEFSGNIVECIDGKMTWQRNLGQNVMVAEDTKDYSIKGKFRVPINPHLGLIGLAPGVGTPVPSNPPYRTGGNIDDRRLGKGSTMYFPVETAGGLLSLGDGHAAMGDSELCGTGIETSLDATLRITLHKAGTLPKMLQGLDFPLLENANEYVVHGYTHNDFIREIPNPQINVYSEEYSMDLNRAMSVCFNNTRDFMMTSFDLTEDEAVSAMSVGVDFGITQVVDANEGIHAIIPKWMFSPSEWKDSPSYTPKTVSGTSKPAKVEML